MKMDDYLRMISCTSSITRLRHKNNMIKLNETTKMFHTVLSIAEA